MTRTLMLSRRQPVTSRDPIACEHRQVCRDGRIICSKIVEGDPTLTPDLCRSCPFAAVNCTHLRFSLRLTSPSPLIVRFNGLTEIWDDDPPQLLFTQAACEAQVCPIEDPARCASCSMRIPLTPAHPMAPVLQPPRRQPAHHAKVVPFQVSNTDSRAATGSH